MDSTREMFFFNPFDARPKPVASVGAGISKREGHDLQFAASGLVRDGGYRGFECCCGHHSVRYCEKHLAACRDRARLRASNRKKLLPGVIGVPKSIDGDGASDK